FLQVDRYWHEHELAQKSPAPVATAGFDPIAHIKDHIAILVRAYLNGHVKWSWYTALVWFLIDATEGLIVPTRVQLTTSTQVHTINELLGATSCGREIDNILQMGDDCELEIYLTSIEQIPVAQLARGYQDDTRPCRTIQLDEPKISAIQTEIIARFPRK
ncbi:MAG: hypothetical protein V1763_01920, partial [Parcubacteria group bacterium]